MAYSYSFSGYTDPITRSFTNPIDHPSAVDYWRVPTFTPSSGEPTIAPCTITSAATPYDGQTIRLTTAQKQLLAEIEGLPDIVERCMAFPREYALAQPDKYPITHRLHQSLMHLSVNGVRSAPDGVDFTTVCSTINAEELGMAYVCRTYGVDPAEYLKVVRSEHCKRMAESFRASNPARWDRWSELYRQRKFPINPEAYAQIAYALTGPFRDKYQAVLRQKVSYRGWN